MADADEDAIPRSSYTISSSSGDNNADPTIDLEDEAQDFRFLASLTSKSSGSSALPKRGEKDFEPNPTQAQSNTLAASREAMHAALSVERVLIPQNPLVGQYLSDPKDWRWDVFPGVGTEHETQGKGGRCVVVQKFRTTFARNIGVADFRNWVWLLPEEALFLLERGTLDVRWPDERVLSFMNRLGGNTVETDGGSDTGSRDGFSEDDSENGGEEQDQDDGVEKIVKDEKESTKKKRSKKNAHHTPLLVGEVPMSLQAAYATFIGKSGLTLERYNVYAHLRRLGYVLQRASTWDDNDDTDEETHEHYTNRHVSVSDGHITQPLLSDNATSTTAPEEPKRHSQPNPATALLNRLISFITTPKQLHHNASHGPLIYPGLYNNYSDIFRTLSLIPHHPHPTPNPTTTPKAKPPYTIAYHVFKPSTPYRKSSPPKPDFRVSVLDARTSSVPTALEIGGLLDTMPDDQLPAEKRMEMRMKHGTRNVVLAVVESGLVSYLRLADVCSGSYGKLFETRTARRGGAGGKRGGGGWKKRGGASGRGR